MVVIISREFLITGLRLLAASKGTILPAEALGKLTKQEFENYKKLAADNNIRLD